MRCFLLLLASAAWAQSSAAIQAQLESVARQRESVRRQVTATVPVTGCDPLAPQEMAPIVESAAKAQDVPAKLVRAVIAQESGFRPCAESKKGAMGLMQLMPATAIAYGVTNAYDPAENIRAGVAYLRGLLDRYSQNEELALAAYNAGPTAVEKYGAVPPYRETRSYVAKIQKNAGTKPAPLHVYKVVEIKDGREVVRYTNTPPK
jgi:hypothetical protein